MAVNKYITDKNHHHNLFCPFSSRTGGNIFLYGVVHAFAYVVFTTCIVYNVNMKLSYFFTLYCSSVRSPQVVFNASPVFETHCMVVTNIKRNDCRLLHSGISISKKERRLKWFRFNLVITVYSVNDQYISGAYTLLNINIKYYIIHL